MNRRNWTSIVCAAVSAWAASGTTAHAAVIYGGATYDPTAGTGFQSPSEPTLPGHSAGNAAGTEGAVQYSGNNFLGVSAIVITTAGNTVLNNTDGVSTVGVTPYAINFGGAVVGVASNQASYWASGTTKAALLGNLGASSTGALSSRANIINANGVIGGYSEVYGGATGSTDLGFRAVRWDSSTAAATQLGNLGTSTAGSTQSQVYNLNVNGLAVGYATKYGVPTGGTTVSSLGARATSWAAGQTGVTELGNLGLSTTGTTTSNAYGVNAGGTAVGQANKYASGSSVGTRAVAWNTTTAAATELGNLGTSTTGFTSGKSNAINIAGLAVGQSTKYTAGGTSLGNRAVLWDTTTATPTAVELGNLGTNDGTSGPNATGSITDANDLDINDLGLSVGVESAYTSTGTLLGDRAVVWNPDGTATDINSLLTGADAADWTLTLATSISSTDWVTGIGTYNPNGTSSTTGSYTRAFLVQVPEPGSLGVIAMGGVTLFSRRRRRQA